MKAVSVYYNFAERRAYYVVNDKQVDAMSYAKEGILAEKVDELFL